MPDADPKAAEILQKIRVLLGLEDDANRDAFDEALIEDEALTGTP